MISIADLRYRSLFLQAIRRFFLVRDYIEVDTPIRLPVLLPEAEILPFRSEGWFLQTSPELWMKRLLAQGCQRLFQICHCFRRGEHGRYHCEEFTMLEWYHSGWSYDELMQECEDLLVYLGRQPDMLETSGLLPRKDRKIFLTSPFHRLTVAEAFMRATGSGPEDALAADRFDEVLVTKIEPDLGWQRPLFLYDYPRARASLACLHPDNPRLAQRFELYIGGIELANGFTELVDPEEQRQRFEQELIAVRKHGFFWDMPHRFLDELDTLQPCAGIALGIDRLLMLFCGKDSLHEVVVGDGEDL